MPGLHLVGIDQPVVTMALWSRGEKIQIDDFSSLLLVDHPVELIAQHTGPVAQDMGPMAQDMGPMAQDMGPVAQDMGPVILYTELVVQLTEPVVQLTEPVVQLTEPVVQLTEPVVQLTEPVVQLHSSDLKNTHHRRETIQRAEPVLVCPEPTFLPLDLVR